MGKSMPHRGINARSGSELSKEVRPNKGLKRAEQTGREGERGGE